MEDQKYLNCLARCPKCNTRLVGKIKVASRGDVVDLISFKKVSPECVCTKCGQLYESRPHMRSRVLLSLSVSVIIMIFTVPMVLLFGSLIHISLGIVLAFLTMWASLVLPTLLMPSYKPKIPNQKPDPTRKTPVESGDIYSRAGQL